jgi:hypothetical protein
MLLAASPLPQILQVPGQTLRSVLTVLQRTAHTANRGLEGLIGVQAAAGRRAEVLMLQRLVQT